MHGDYDDDAGQTIGVAAERFRAFRVAQRGNAQRLEQRYVNDYLVRHFVVVPPAGGSKRATNSKRGRENAVVVVGADTARRIFDEGRVGQSANERKKKQN